jgi:hypothetical protein
VGLQQLRHGAVGSRHRGCERTVLLRLHENAHLRTARHEFHRKRSRRHPRQKSIHRLHAHGAATRTTRPDSP